MERRSASRRRRSPVTRLATVLIPALVLAAASGIGWVPPALADSLTGAESIEPSGLQENTASFWATPEPIDAPIDVRFTDLDLGQAVRFLTGEETEDT